MSEASENLRYHQKQLDEDGVMVGVSRQAVEETLLELMQLREAVKDACDLLAERTHGSPARSPGHNARLRLEAAIAG